MNNQTYINTDKEIWRERKGDFYSSSIHVTKGNSIGIDCGGHVIVAPVKTWHECGEKLLCVNENLPWWMWKIVEWILNYNYKCNKRDQLQ